MVSSKGLHFSSWPIKGTLTNITTPVGSGPGNKSSKEILHIPQSSWTGISLSDSLMSYSGHSLSYIVAEMQSAYFTAQVDLTV